jgi:RNA polymerase sigma-70 factor (ECF subfamily)
LPGLPRLTRYEFDRDYVNRLVAEDPETERHFTRYFGDLLSLKLRSKLRSAALIEDAKQETFVRVLTTLKRKRGLASAESLGAFVNSVCNNVLFEFYRSGAREAMGDLPQKEKDLLRWLFFEGRDKDDVCRELNIDRNYLRVLLHRAKNRFRDRYSSSEETH